MAARCQYGIGAAPTLSCMVSDPNRSSDNFVISQLLSNFHSMVFSLGCTLGSP